MTGRLAALLLAGVLAACGGAPGDDTGAQPATGAPRGEVVDFTTEDGIELEGLQFGSGERAVVLAHMRGSNKGAWADAAAAFARNGIAAFPFDFRGYEGQEGRQDENLDVDLVAAIKEMRARGSARIFVVGASMGGTAALEVAVQQKLDGVVAVSAPAEFGGIDAVAAAGNVEEPSLFIVARDDQPYAQDARQLSEVAGGQVLMFDGGAHGTDLLDEHHDELIAAIIGFVKDPTAPRE